MMNEQQTLVQCGTITYVYTYNSAKTISKFSFEDEIVQLKCLLAKNFMNDFVTYSYKLNISYGDVEGLQSHLESFLEHFAKRGLKYIAVLDLVRKKPCIYLITNKGSKLSNEELSEAWGNKVCSRYVDYNELQISFPAAAEKSSALTTEYIFMSSNLKKPRRLHNDTAEDFLYKYNIFDAYEYDEYEVHDEQCGTVAVAKYINFPF